MRIVAVDDEALALETLTDAIAEAAPDAELHAFRDGKSAIEYVKDTRAAAEGTRSDLQSFLDDQLTYLNKQANYIIRKKLMGEDAADTTPVPIEPATESYNMLF